MNKQSDLISIFSQLEDPRSHINKLHNLTRKIHKKRSKLGVKVLSLRY